ncbi:hypothetical protein OS188_06870 [Xanthomarina sp. F1114]|nr:hypothetical protein [Xanthomarina sp. F1114]MCX7547669.1 hypothetical protein [Xanthomarina sp. F1114]
MQEQQQIIETQNDRISALEEKMTLLENKCINRESRIVSIYSKN